MTADEARKLVEKAEKQPKIDKALYKEAIDLKYRFFSFGDAMIIL